MRDFGDDVRHGLRLIGKAPGFSIIAVLSLGAGIGAATVLFSVANGMVLRPVTETRPHEIIQVFTGDSRGRPYGSSSYADFLSFRATDAARLLASTRVQATLSDAERPEVAQGLLVSPEYFPVLGLTPAAGRFFTPAEGDPRNPTPVAVLSHDAWRRRHGSDPAVVGREIELSGRRFVVIGVGPERFTGTFLEENAEFFVPISVHAAFRPGRDPLLDRADRTFRVLGRLSAGATAATATASLGAIAVRLQREDPAAWQDAEGHPRGVLALPETDGRFVGAAPGAIAALMAGVGAGAVLLLAIACVNVATLLLARASARRREIAVRLALGASRGRLIRQLLTEAAILAVLGGALGLAIAGGAASLFHRFRPPEIPSIDLTLDPRILAFGVLASAATVLFCALAPALQATRRDVDAELKDTGNPVRVRGVRFNLRSGLVVVQCAVSLALLSSGALLLRSAVAGVGLDPGFRRDAILNLDLDLSAARNDAARRQRFYREALAVAASLPGVERAALAALVPLGGTNRHVYFQPGAGAGAARETIDINVVSAGYFGLLDVPVLRGREFDATDVAGAPVTAVVNEALARKFWNGDAVGRVFLEGETGSPVRVVGVVRDVRHRSFGEEARPMAFFAADQRLSAQMTLHLLTSAPASVVDAAARRALRAIDRGAAFSAAESMRQYFERVTMPHRLGGLAAIATAGLQLALSAMALYGVVAFIVAERTREIGLRRALGASRSSVTALVMREGLVLAATGTALGAGLVVAAGAALQEELIGVGPVDPVSFLASASVLTLVCAVASFVPARRAASVDPGAALRRA